MHRQYAIPNRINLFIIGACSISYFSLLYAASNTSDFLVKMLYAFVFAVMMIPVYSLIHEAEHENLFAQKDINLFFGRWLCCLFIAPYTFMKHCHLKHHKKNRTDEEMWDLYYEHQDKMLRHGNLYLMMMGFGYFAIWLSVIVFAFLPGFVRHKLLRSHKEINGFLVGADDQHKLPVSRFEAMVVIIFQLVVLWGMDWDIGTWALLLAAHGFVWSSQNYVNHAFSPRDIINGAHNLKVPIWLNFIYLNFNIHLVHHQHPQIPWIHLGKFLHSGKNRISFFRNYLRLWKGPRMTKDPAPGAIK